MNPGHRGGKPAAKCMNYGMAKSRFAYVTDLRMHSLTYDKESSAQKGLCSHVAAVTHTVPGIAVDLTVLFRNSMSQPSTDTGFVGNLICPLAMAIWLPIDIQPTNTTLITPPTSAPCRYKK